MKRNTLLYFVLSLLLCSSCEYQPYRSEVNEWATFSYFLSRVKSLGSVFSVRPSPLGTFSIPENDKEGFLTPFLSTLEPSETRFRNTLSDSILDISVYWSNASVSLKLSSTLSVFQIQSSNLYGLDTYKATKEYVVPEAEGLALYQGAQTTF